MIKGLAFADRLHQLDRWAMGLSGLCVAHCLASSIFFAVMASAGSVFLHPLVHEIGPKVWWPSKLSKSAD